MLGPRVYSKARKGVCWEKGVEHQERGSEVRRRETQRRKVQSDKLWAEMETWDFSMPAAATRDKSRPSL